MSKVVLLTGGVGGAKLALGLEAVLDPADLTSIVNTGDDFVHLGLAISPDIDTLAYTLSGKASVANGWGREDESWAFMATLRELGGEDWFLLGDRDLALHTIRTGALKRGESLSAITARLARALGVRSAIVPMSDHIVSTFVDTDEGPLAFQRYFVERRCAPAVHAIRFEGAAAARPAPAALAALADPSLRAILIAPSNPFLSVDPILAVPGFAKALRAAKAPIVAVSPLVDGKAVKGPTSKLMAELAIAASHASIAAHYDGIIDGLLIDRPDAGAPLSIAFAETDTMMVSAADKARVARAALALADSLA
ncbi:2-phospho-L-lactate transferase [Sphingomonas naphthae]|uniref:2-phospho-L-lactate transferase n=1 Tax=Sphingomonas naphthae TaxID=1813468 RepID=A0ABY7TK11_9SPHN|nr:2-phospho-L-lactate transferase [Sphingomonas naphthae]WCT73504.1 2-phospho-L-lactate transferase [Sphingomonas naphthae]